MRNTEKERESDKNENDDANKEIEKDIRTKF